MNLRLLAVAASLAAGTSAVFSQESRPARAPISIGNYPAVNGLRLNFRDSDLERVHGVNITIWEPYEPASGTVTGAAIGLPLTGAGEIHGLATGIFGVSASRKLSGLTLAPIGAGAGGDVSGIAIGGVGLGAGGNLGGLIVGGVGAGAGGNLKGIIVGGVGVGGGGNVSGLVAGGVGAGVAGDVEGVIIGGVGAGAGGTIKGVSLTGVGTGAGGNIVGFVVSGIGTGAGGTIRGIALAGVGIGAPRLVGGFGALAVGANDARGFVLAPALFRIERGGSFSGHRGQQRELRSRLADGTFDRTRQLRQNVERHASGRGEHRRRRKVPSGPAAPQLGIPTGLEVVSTPRSARGRETHPVSGRGRSKVLSAARRGRQRLADPEHQVRHQCGWSLARCCSSESMYAA